MKKSVTLIMGKIYNPETDRIEFGSKNFKTIVQTVRDFNEAKEYVLKFVEEGVEDFELCGAFGKEKARELIELTEHKVGISYVVTDEDMKPLVDEFYTFGKKK
ncbi:DUF6506 family protein [Miniphocaeibacter halophilus]|uniref:Uncharacterized protein n=1 Tax=Miniphocaeibacter halophilus TaxID=2931922 RepID=A0AC61MZ28_9FIRM|nr:DUF6506 family protein [Miniphocaeibacter halophilus]QQK08479.1 hypothetical protein JFY71_02780 [Miniphocaeibacter halophilus]